MIKKILMLALFMPAFAQARSLPQGPNHLQNPPILTSAISDGSQTTVTGRMVSFCNTQLLIQFFSNPIDRGTITEGLNFLGEIRVTTNRCGNAVFKATLPCSNSGTFISATATRINSSDEFTDTSEFSRNIVVR